MISPIHRIKSQRGGRKEFTPDDLIQIRHDMMVCYGWIPIEEFMKLSNPEMWDLHELVKKEKKIMYTAYQAQMGAAGMKKGDIREAFK